MKFLGVFNSLPDIVFVWYDSGFLTHLQRTLVKNDLPEDLDLNDEEVRLNVINQFFSPVIASQKYMASIDEPFSSIVCENGNVIAINNESGLYYVALCGDGEESEWFLKKKISVFKYLMSMLFGPATDQLRPASTLLRQQRWKLLGSLLETWQKLSQQEHIFLVEALERLHVNHDLNLVCLNLLGEVLSKSNKGGHALHSLLMVNNKLLGLYSTQNAPELQTSDILMLTIFMKEKFDYVDKTVPLSFNKSPPQLTFSKISDGNSAEETDQPPLSSAPMDVVSSNYHDKQTNDSPGSCVEYMSAKSTPHFDQGGPVVEGFHTPNGGSPISTEETEETLDQIQLSGSETEDNSACEDTAIGERKPSTDSEHVSSNSVAVDGESGNEGPIYHQIPLLLRTVDCSFTPHVVDFIRLDYSTVLITISESKLVYFAMIINHILKVLDQINPKYTRDYTPHSSGSTVRAKFYENLEAYLRKLVHGALSHYELQYKSLVNAMAILRECWEVVKENGLKMYLESTDNTEMSPKLESSLVDLEKTVKSIFTLIFITQRKPKSGRLEKHIRIVSNIREVSINKLSFFSSYLQVRGQRNGTMTAYNNDFPGLVHFIYVNRKTNQLITPTINRHNSMQDMIKQHVWEMWQYVEYHVTQGYTSFIVKDTDFSYSYFLWFEDEMGKPMPVQKLPAVSYENRSTGLLSNNFYANLVKQCFPALSHDAVCCYQLFCMHIGIVSNRFIATSCKKLASQLWEASGEASSPIGLL